MSIGTAPLLRGKHTQSAAADNATATATVAAVANQRHMILGVEAHFSAAVTAIVAVTVNYNSLTWTERWDFTNGPFFFNFPVGLMGAVGSTVTATLGASGTGGTNGYVTLFTALD